MVAIKAEKQRAFRPFLSSRRRHCAFWGLFQTPPNPNCFLPQPMCELNQFAEIASSGSRWMEEFSPSPMRGIRIIANGVRPIAFLGPRYCLMERSLQRLCRWELPSCTLIY